MNEQRKLETRVRELEAEVAGLQSAVRVLHTRLTALEALESRFAGDIGGPDGT